MVSLCEHPDLYDLVANQTAPPGQVDFYAEQARRADGEALELACGTGRVTLAMARAETKVVGLDLSPEMVKTARTRAESEGLSCEFSVGDMRNFSFDKRFRSIVIAHHSLQHLLDSADIDACLACCRAHLAPGGVLVFDVFNPEMRLLARDPAQRFPVGEITGPSGETITLEEKTDYDAATQVSRITWFVSRQGQRDFLEIPLRLRNIFPAELPRVLAANGLELVERFGDFEGAPFRSDSANQVCICRSVED